MNRCSGGACGNRWMQYLLMDAMRGNIAKELQKLYVCHWADGYGHGTVEIAKRRLKTQLSLWLCSATVEKDLSLITESKTDP